MAAKLGAPRGTRWAVVTALAAVSVFALEYFWGEPELVGMRQPGDVTHLQTTGVARDYNHVLSDLTLHVSSAASRAEALNDGWLIHEITARAWLFRARLTGSYDDYRAAEVALRRSEGMAAPRTGPHMTGALLSFGMHRLRLSEEYLDRIDEYAVPPDPGDLAETRALRGDIAFYRGDYAGATALYDEADNIAPGTSDFRRAIFYSKTGRPDLSEQYIDRAERGLVNPTRPNRSFLELHRGILDLDRGRLDHALTHFRRADSIFPGHWLIEEHIAEIAALKNDLDTAEKLYLKVIRRTGHPEFMDALASVAARRGDATAVKRWTNRAAAAWDARLKQFPEAAYGHALDHCIGKKDWGCALSLAKRNHLARPYGDAKVAFARALLGSGRHDEAKAMIEAVLASPWRTAELHRTASDIYAAGGMAVAAAEQDRLARNINPLV